MHWHLLGTFICLIFPIVVSWEKGKKNTLLFFCLKYEEKENG